MCILTIAVFLQIGNRLIVRAWQDDEGKYIICHCVKEHCETLHLPLIAANNHLKNHPGDHEDSCRTELTPTPTICRPTITPTIEATPTASLSATLTPTASPEAKLEPNQERHDEPLSNDTTHNSNPNCDTPKPDKVAWFTYDSGKPNDGIVQLKWALPIRADRFNIEYSEVVGQPRHGKVVFGRDGNTEISFLKNIPYWFRIQAQDGCATSEFSNWIDPLP